MAHSLTHPPRYRRNQAVQWTVLCASPRNNYSCKGRVETVLSSVELSVRRSDGGGFRVRWVNGIGLVAGWGLRKGEHDHECLSAVA